MSVKKELRREYKLLRKQLHSADADLSVCKLLIESEFYKAADIVLLYASLDDEICIDSVIINSLVNGKKTALPVCRDDNGNMDFYYINSLDDLKTGSFSVREPDTLICKKCIDFTNCLCVVPGIAFDKRGYRLGYGKGYYDRFLQNLTFNCVGLCYNELIVGNLPNDEFDIPVDYIVTQDKVVSVLKEEDNNGK